MILKQKISEMKEKHSVMKKEFDLKVSGIRKEYETLNDQNIQKKQSYFESQISIDMFKEKGNVLDLIYNMLEQEKLY